MNDVAPLLDEVPGDVTPSWLVVPGTAVESSTPALVGGLGSGSDDMAATDGGAILAYQPERSVAGGQQAVPLSASFSGLDLVHALSQLSRSADWLEQAALDLSPELIGAWLSAVRRHPIDFVVGLIVGVFTEIWGMLKGILRLLLAAAQWEARITGCIEYAVYRGLAELVLDDILGTDLVLNLPADPTGTLAELRSFMAAIASGAEGLVDVYQSAQQHPVEFATFMVNVAVDVMQALTRTLEINGSLRAKLLGAMSDSATAGKVTGSATVNIFLTVGTGGVGDAALGAEGVALAAETGNEIAMAARAAEEAQQLTAAASTAEDASAASALISEIMSALRRSLNSQGMRFSQRVTDGKLTVFTRLEKLSTVSGSAIAIEQRRLVAATLSMRGRVGLYRELLAPLAEFNDRSKILYLYDLLRYGGVSISDAGAALTDGQRLASLSLGEQLFDAAHIVDARFFEYFSSEARQALGWASTDDMPAVVATASEHRSSWPAYFKGFARESQSSPAALPEDLAEVRSITAVFRRRLVKVNASGAPLKGEAMLGPDAVAIGPKTTATEIVTQCRKVWLDKQFSSPGGITTQHVLETFDEILTKLQGK